MCCMFHFIIIYKGIGYSISEKLCAAGVHVIIACRDDVAGIAAANRLADKGYHSEFRIVDISTTESIDKFLDVLEVSIYL